MDHPEQGLEHFAARVWLSLSEDRRTDLDRESWMDGFVISAGVIAGLIPEARDSAQTPAVVPSPA